MWLGVCEPEGFGLLTACMIRSEIPGRIGGGVGDGDGLLSKLFLESGGGLECAVEPPYSSRASLSLDPIACWTSLSSVSIRALLTVRSG